MNIEGAPHWLPAFLVPFVTLSYPTLPPAKPDSFPTSNYYSTGLLDGCFMITCIAVMAILRDASRLGIMEPFAKWYLTRKFIREKKKKGAPNGTANGVTNGQATTNGTAKSNGNLSSSGKSNGAVIGNGPIPRPEKHTDLAQKSRKEERLIHRSVLRFAEQGWSVIYYITQWSFGLYIHCNLPAAPFSPKKVWEGFPHIPLSGPLKFYYLCQTSFYLHQVLIINAEARRKDHVQMMTHHVITIALLLTSYAFNCTRVGCLILVIMDWCDIFLPLAKMFRYLALPTLCDATFVWFLLSWLVTRHFLFINVIYSNYKYTPRMGPYLWDPSKRDFLPYSTWIAFFNMLCALQIIQIMWFWMIGRVAWKVVSGQGAEDTRSDDEGGDSELEHDTIEQPIPPHSELKKKQ